MSPELSIVIISYNASRQLARTIKSLLPPFQIGVVESDLELIVVDNGSKQLPRMDDFLKSSCLRIIDNPNKSMSPVFAINLGLSVAKSNLICVMIDGARMASPGLLKHALLASRLSDRVVISTLGFHLGPGLQMKTVLDGYNEKIEDQLLHEIDWQANGYRLFEISVLAGSSAKGYFMPIAESNAIFMSKALWQELDGYEERFVSPGGGFANLDTYCRACELPNIDLAILLGEGTFHQVHGGVATNSSQAQAIQKIFRDEYESIRKKKFTPPDKRPIFIGSDIPEARSVLKSSLENPRLIRHDYGVHCFRANRILLDNSNCKTFKSDNSISDHMLDRPVIITGRGGSGTRLISEMLQGMHVFLGNDINETQDSVEWVRLIYGLVTNRVRIKNGRFKQKHIDRLRENARNILGIRGITSGMWGFKLPETMLCLPELLAAFPSAKFIHLVRHPISISMRRSHMTSRLGNPIGNTVLKDAYLMCGLDPEDIPNGSDAFKNAVSWAYQLDLAMNFFKHDLDESQFITIKYEDLIANSGVICKILSEFLNISLSSKIHIGIDPSRANESGLLSSQSNDVWALCGKWASDLGYAKENVSGKIKIVFIGGVGGSGTRVVARILKENGIFIGSNLNKSLDNMDWPGKRNVVENRKLSNDKKVELLKTPFVKFIESMVSDLKRNTEFDQSIVGVKVPGSYYYLPYLLEIFDDFKYIHIIRHGLDMAFSPNRGQLRNWGGRFDLDSSNGDVAQLKYWIKANDHALQSAERLLGDNFKLIHFENLCDHPEKVAEDILNFIGSDSNLTPDFYGTIKRPASFGRYKNKDISIFDKEDILDIGRFGYEI